MGWREKKRKENIERRTRNVEVEFFLDLYLIPAQKHLFTGAATVGPI